MEQVNTIELGDPAEYPSDDVLKKVLGSSFSTYTKVLKLFDELGLQVEWRYYKDGKAWLCKVIKGKKTMVWMSAWKKYMKASIYFQERYAEQLFSLNITEEMKKTIATSKNVGKSKPVMFDLVYNKNLTDFKKVLFFKMKLK